MGSGGGEDEGCLADPSRQNRGAHARGVFVCVSSLLCVCVCLSPSRALRGRVRERRGNYSISIETKRSKEAR